MPLTAIAGWGVRIALEHLPERGARHEENGKKREGSDPSANGAEKRHGNWAEGIG